MVSNIEKHTTLNDLFKIVQKKIKNWVKMKRYLPDPPGRVAANADINHNSCFFAFCLAT